MHKVEKETTLFEELMQWQTSMSRTKLKQCLQHRRVLVNGRAVTQFNHPLHVGDVIAIGQSDHGRGDANSRYLKILYEDRYLVVINKNEGILSMATSHHAFCVKRVLDGYFDRTHQKCRAHLVHRLDRDTSGLMIFAKSRDVQMRFEADWKGIVYDRRYVAVAEGVMPTDEGTVSNWLKDNKQYFTYSSPVDNGGKFAVTHYRVLERGQNNTLVELKLDTGRKNQIRVHLSDLGHPVLGDPKYGAVADIVDTPMRGNADVAPSSHPAAKRLCLHAYRLHFTHPVTGETMQFDTPVPNYFLSLL